MTFPDLAALAVALGASYAAAFLGSLATRRGLRSWYGQLARPSWTPPGGVIGAVWSVLYTLMGIAAWLAWRSGGDAAWLVAAFGGQLVLNVLWSVLFFGARRVDLALAEIVVLWVAVFATTLVFARSSLLAAGLMLPYLAWVAFAGFLNYRIWRLNAPTRRHAVRVSGHT